MLTEWAGEATGKNGDYKNQGILLFEFKDRDQIKHPSACRDFGLLRRWGFPR